MIFPWDRIIDYSPYYADWREGVAYLLAVTLLCALLAGLGYRQRGAAAGGRLFALALLLFVAGISLWKVNVFPDDGDAAMYLTMTHSLAFDFDPDLSNEARDEAWRRSRWPYYHFGGVRGASVDGKKFSPFDIGLPLLAAPFYRAGGRLGVVLLLNLFWLGAALAAGALARAMVTDRTAVGFALAAVFCTSPMLVFANMCFAEIMGAFFLVVLGWCAYRRAPGRSWPLLAAVATLLLVMAHVRFFLPAAGLWLFLLIDRRGERRQWLVSAAGAAAAYLAVHWLVNGHPVPMYLLQHGDDVHRFSLAAVGRGAAGLLLDREIGLFIYAPVYLIGLLAWARFIRPQRRYFLLLLAAAVPYFCFIAGYDEYHANIGGATRYLVVVLPLFTPLLALTYQALPRMALFRITAWGLLFLSLAIALFHTLIPALSYGPCVGLGIPQPFVKINGLRGQDGYEYFPSFCVPPQRVLDALRRP